MQLTVTDIEQLKKEIPQGGGVFGFNAMQSQKPLQVADVGSLDQVVFQFLRIFYFLLSDQPINKPTE